MGRGYFLLTFGKVVSDGWQHSVSIVTLETFNFLASQSGTNIAKYIDLSPELSSRLIKGLSTKIVKYASSTHPEIINFVAGCFKCIGEWIICSETHNLIATDSLSNTVAHVARIGFESSTVILQQAALALWGVLLHQTDSHLGSGVSSLTSEIDFLEEIAVKMGKDVSQMQPEDLWNEYGATVRIFSLNDNIVSIIDVPELPGQIGPPRVNMIIRTAYGKFVWRATMNLFGDEQKEDAIICTNPLPIEIVPPVTYGQTPVPDVVTFTDQPEIMHRTEWLMDQTAQYLQSINFGLEVSVDFLIPWRPSSEMWESFAKSHYTRLFLSHMGLLHPNTYEAVSFLASKPTLLETLRSLDVTPEREVTSVSVLFWGKGQRDITEIFTNHIGSHRFHEFVDSLGWMINIEAHTGYKGDVPLYEIPTPWGLPYWCDNTHEILWEVSILFENIPKAGVDMDPSLVITKKQDILMKNPFCIVWVEHEYDWIYSMLDDGYRSHYFIVIIPIHSGLYRIKIITEDNPNIFFANNAIVSGHMLALYVRRIIKVFHSIIHSKQSPEFCNMFWSAPFFLYRKQAIDNILHEHESALSYDQFLETLFSSAPVLSTERREKKGPIARVGTVTSRKLEPVVSPPTNPLTGIPKSPSNQGDLGQHSPTGDKSKNLKKKDSDKPPKPYKSSKTDKQPKIATKTSSPNLATSGRTDSTPRNDTPNSPAPVREPTKRKILGFK